MQRILVVHDNAEIAALVRTTAERLGVGYRVVTDVRQMRDQYFDYRPDIVIVPEHGGDQVIDLIVASGIPSRVVMIFAGSAAAQCASEGAAMSLPAQAPACSCCPLQPDDLMTVLVDLFGRN
jgi:CheY-like chemotaxis protein